MGNAGTGSKADVAVKLVLIFFISLLSFSVGTFVGKQVSDADHRRAELENNYETDGIDAAKTAQATPDANAVSDEEVASLTEEFVNAERKTASAGEATVDEHATEHATEHVNAADPAATASKDGYAHVSGANAKADTVHHAADRVAENKAPAADPKKVRKPSTALPSVATSAIGKYTVQVYSYATESEARAQVAKLKEKGYGAFYVPAEVKGQTWYRVSVGLFTNHKSAMDYRKEILDSKAVSSAIVQRIVK